MSDEDDVFDLEDLRSMVGGVRPAGDVGELWVVVGVVLAIVAVGVALALVPHTLGAVGGSTVDTGSGPTSPADAGSAEAQQQYQNQLTNVTFVLAPPVLVVGAVVAAFAVVRRVAGARRSRVAVVALAGGLGVAVGFVVFAVVGHLAYAPTGEGFYVQGDSVSFRPWTAVVNAVALGAAGAVGSAIAAAAGTLLDPAEAVVGADVEADDEPSGDGHNDDDRTWTGVDADADSSADPAVSDDADDADSTAGDGASASSASADGGPASDYRDTGQGTGSEPRYDPDDRDWDGASDDG